MPQQNPTASNKRKKVSKIITDLTHVSQDDHESDPEASEFDLGTKIKTPKDTMLEELSLLKNKGSKMFRMRQQRVEKFIVTNEHMQNLQNLLMSPPVPPPKPEKPKQEVEKKVDQAEMENMRKAYVRTYVSPWERAMKGDEELRATMKANMPGPIIYHRDMPKFKSFNRTALPYGGQDKATRLTFELPDVHLDPEDPEAMLSLQADIRLRPSFNRTPIGWVCSEDNSHIHMDMDMDMDTMPFDGETEDL